ncbi:MAG: four helix bundle protein [Ignavibacteriales bacterium]|nr:four helix bundle protein [Ignavibacteriales bacterium]
MIKSHTDLDVYKMSFELAMRIYEISKTFPTEEKYSLTDQIRRSSRSVCSNIAEAFRKRRYPKSFISKLSDSESEAAETQTWLEFSLKCKYISKELFKELDNSYNNVIGKLVVMMNQSEKWTI